MQPTRLEQLTEILKSKGMNDEQIEEYLINLNNAVAEQIYNQMLLSLTEEDLNFIDNIPEEQVLAEITTRYEKATGKTPQALSEELYDTFMQSFTQAINNPEEES